MNDRKERITIGIIVVTVLILLVLVDYAKGQPTSPRFTVILENVNTRVQQICKAVDPGDGKWLVYSLAEKENGQYAAHIYIEQCRKVLPDLIFNNGFEGLEDATQ